MRRVYLDNNATTPVLPAVRRVIDKTLRNSFGNPSSKYEYGGQAAAIIDGARASVAGVIGASEEEIVFTGSASEANNHLLVSCVENAPAGRNVIVSSPIEHPSVLNTLKYLADNGTIVRYCPVDSYGRIKMDDLAELVDEHTILVCVMLANNETGVIQDIPKIARLAHDNGAWLMSDCVQALGKIPLDMTKLGIDFASFSAHKVHGPKGVGAVYSRTGLPLAPFIHGGHQESGLRAGTESVHNIAGFGEACRHVPAMLAAAGHTSRLRNRLASGIRAIMPAARFNSDVKERDRLPNTLNVTFPGCESEEAIAFLDYKGISVSAGSACNAQVREPSAVLKALGLDDEAAGQTLRLSLSDRTSLSDVKYTLEVLRQYLTQTEREVTSLSPSRLNKKLLFDDDVVIVDVRHGLDRKMLKSLPRSLETSSAQLRTHYGVLPRDKQIIVICQVGFDASLGAYFLRSKGYEKVAFVPGGVVGWRLAHPDLYDMYGGQDTRPMVGA